jgi:nucleoside-diphosphate kinase
MTERSLILIKPDAVRRGLTGAILDRYLAKGFSVVALQQRTATGGEADAHYAEHVEKGWYPGLRSFITSGPLVALVLEGDRVVESVRLLNGATDGIAAAPGTIRGDWSASNQQNLVHGSDSVESAAREIGVWFPGLK